MRKCIDLENHPGFEQIQSPVLLQAIDRGLAGFSGTGVVDWGYIPPGPPTKPIRGKVPKQKLPDYKNGKHYNVVNPVRLGGDEYWDYIFNTHATPEARALVNKYPPIPIVVASAGGKFASHEGIYGTVHARKGTTHDIGTLFHEYGHALDHMMGELTGANDTFQERLAYSRGLVQDFMKEGERMGLIFDDSVYWEYIKENGLDFKLTTRGRRYHIAKGHTRQEMEAKMTRGDHWRIMEYLLKKVKTDLQNVQNVSKPDPVKVAKAESMKKRMEKLYDQHINRVKVAKKMLIDVEKALGLDRDNISWNLQAYQAGSIADIIDALSGGELYDYQVATRDMVLISGHGSSYFAMRQGKRGIRNHRQEQADLSKRVEIWAQFFQFNMMQDKTPYNILKKLMPQTEKKFASLLKAGYNIPVNTPEPFNQTIFNEEIPVAAEIQRRYETDKYTEDRIKGMTTQELISELLHSHSTSYNDMKMIRKEIKLRKARGEKTVRPAEPEKFANPRTTETTLITRPEDIKPDTIMYHLTNSKNVGNILKYGLTSRNPAINSLYRGSTGISKASKIFAWTDFNAAQRYSTRSRWNEDLTIIAFKSGNQTWEKDTREMHDQTAFKTPRKKKGSKPAHIPPKNIISYRKIDRGDTLNVMLRGDAQARGGGLFTREVNEGKIPSWKNVKPRTTF